MRSVEEIEQELYESEAGLEALEESLAGSRVADLTDLVSKTGKMRGHLTGLTPKQYRKAIGKPPPPGLLKKAKDATTRKVQWDMVLDQLASERGYKTDEELREDIEKAYNAKQELAKLKSRQGFLRGDIIDRLRAEPEVETITLSDVCPQFPDSVCSAEVTMINGMTFRLRRQHSYWRLDTDRGAFKIRYAVDAQKLARLATKEYKGEIREARTTQLKRKRIPKRRSQPRRIQTSSGIMRIKGRRR